MNLRAAFARAGMKNWGVLQNTPIEDVRARTLPDRKDADVYTPFGRSPAWASLYPNQSARDTGIIENVVLFPTPGVNPRLYLAVTGTPTPQRSAIQIQDNYLDAPASVPGGGVGKSVKGAGTVNMLGPG